MRDSVNGRTYPDGKFKKDKVAWVDPTAADPGTDLSNSYFYMA